MSAMIIYLLKANLLIAIFFLFYFLVCRREKFFWLNRLFLLSILALSVLLPLLPAYNAMLPVGQQGSGGLPRLLAPIRAIASPFSSDPAIGLEPASRGKAGYLLPLFMGIYGLITTILLVRLAFQVLRLMAFIKSSPQSSQDGIVYCTTDRELAPFSFFHYLVLNESSYSPEQMRQIVLHEKVHIRQGHTFDLLLAELVCVFFWINPLVRLLRRQLKLNLEYIADEIVLDSGQDKKNYQWGLLQSSLLSTATYPLTNLFHSSKIKLRIKMMNTTRSSGSHLYKYLLALPLIAAAYFVVSPLSAATLPVAAQKLKAERKAQKLKAFEGFYSFTFAHATSLSYIQIIAKDTTLVLKQMWDDKEISFKQTAPLEFLNGDGEKPFLLKFSKDEKGVITKVLAFDRDLWTRANDYKPVIKTAIRLSPAQLSAFEGTYKYKVGDEKEERYLQFKATDTGIVLKQMWDGEEIPFRPESETAFFCKDPAFTLVFTKNGDGVISQALIGGRDLWVRTQK